MEHVIPPPNPWKKLGSRHIYTNPWLTLREDQVVRPDGSPGIYGVVEIRPSVGALALNDRDEVILVGQWRYPRNEFRWELPVGGSDPGELDLLGAAQRELREETGLEAQCWTKLGTVEAVVGVTTDTGHLFRATGLTASNTHHDPEEAIITRWVPFEDAVRMARRDEITEALSVTAILREALNRLGG